MENIISILPSLPLTNKFEKNKWRNLHMETMQWKSEFKNYPSIKCKRRVNHQHQLQIQSMRSHIHLGKLCHMTLHMRKNYKCHIKMNERSSKLIYKSSSLATQVEVANQDGTIGLHTCMTWLQPQITYLQTKLKENLHTYFSYFLFTLIHIAQS